MFKRTIGKELTSLKDYHNTIVYVKSPIGEAYFVDTPISEEYFNHHISQGYIFYEVIDVPYSKEEEDWDGIITYIDLALSDGIDTYDIIENLLKNGYRVTKI